MVSFEIRHEAEILDEMDKDGALRINLTQQAHLAGYRNLFIFYRLNSPLDGI